MDVRMSYNTLSAIVSWILKEESYAGDLYAFCNRRLNRVKILAVDGSTLWVAAKRSERGTFGGPPSDESSLDLTPSPLGRIQGDYAQPEVLLIEEAFESCGENREGWPPLC